MHPVSWQSICVFILSNIIPWSKLVSLRQILSYSKTCLKNYIQIGFQDRLSLNAYQKYCRMLRNHSARLSAFIKLSFVFKTFVLSIFERLLKTSLYSFFACYTRSLIEMNGLDSMTVDIAYQS